ncbi:unnamed protein product [Vitrella brassicaformis CCMP3155]|uniref:Uncharacterized protein n=1 Tax=Vitrella brassicaformis (strain CCMP3155) TaxID=1169540 RepID=A0A0G4FAG7_VITBC|nr:unnamed protein product [Vitrella brassicaformis CCMP3155]|eukprot:CEM09917.1 unnamed protein product [Vitrella brassicaformis CCMP3155]
MHADGEHKFNLDADTTGARCLTSQQFKDFFNKKGTEGGCYRHATRLHNCTTPHSSFIHLCVWVRCSGGVHLRDLEKFYQLMHIKAAEQPEGAAAAAAAAGASGDGVDFEEFVNFFAPPADSNGNNPVRSVSDNMKTLKEEMNKFVAQSQSILGTTGATATATEAQKDQEGQEGGNKEIVEDGDQRQQQMEEGQGHGEGEGEEGDSSGDGTVTAAAGGDGIEGGEGGAGVGDGEEGNEAEGERGDPAMILRKKLFLHRVYALMMIERFEEAVTQLRGVNFELTNHTRKIDGFDELPCENPLPAAQPPSVGFLLLQSTLKSLAGGAATGINEALDQMYQMIAGIMETYTLPPDQNLTGAATAAIAAPSSVPVAAPVSAAAPGFSFSAMPYQAPHLRPPPSLAPPVRPNTPSYICPPPFTYHHTAAMPHPPSAPPPAVVLPAPSPAPAHVMMMPNQAPLQYPTHHGIPGPGGHPMPPPGNTPGRTTRGACPWATHGRIGQGGGQ